MLKTLPDNSVDAVVTDPPYHLTEIKTSSIGAELRRGGRTSEEKAARSGFMGKTWDGGDIAQNPALWSEVLRVLKPGGHVAAFSSTRTGHRMAVAIEDAGFEIRDTCAWVTGQGFPKSLNVSAKLRDSLPADAQCACDLDCPQTAQGSQGSCSSYRDLDGGQPLSDQDSALERSPSLGGAQERTPFSHADGLASEQQYSRSFSSDHCSSGDLDRGVSLQLAGCLASDSARSDTPSNTSSDVLTVERRSQNHTLSKQHLGDGLAVSSQSIPGDKYPNIPRCGKCGKLKVVNGLGSALKPAWEMIYLARKPLSEKSLAANVLRWGTGAINVDGCRVGTPDQFRASVDPKDHASPIYGKFAKGIATSVHHLGRFPANLCHDGSQEVLDLFPDAGGKWGRQGKADATGMFGIDVLPGAGEEFIGDKGSAARFFYCAKASKGDRAGSKHPTVKPVKLMQWLCRLITPPGGTVLDPFAGSGTTGAAAIAEGFNVILIEREDEYVADIRRRLAA